MKTLIFNGSPRKNGNCVTLLRELTRNLEGETRTVSSYYDGISPCIDCRFCKEHRGCALNDGMQEVYNCIETFDNIIIVSPIHFSELSGSLLGLLSRLQTYFCQRYFRKSPVTMTRKNGVLILSGAQKGTEKNPIITANSLFKIMHSECVAFVHSADTDNIPAERDEDALGKARDAALLLNSLYNGAVVNKGTGQL